MLAEEYETLVGDGRTDDEQCLPRFIEFLTHGELEATPGAASGTHLSGTGYGEETQNGRKQEDRFE